MKSKRLELPKEIAFDRFGNPIYPKLQYVLTRQARALTALGFKQAQKKPYLFYGKLPEGILFADMGGTDVIPIWSDSSIYIHWKFRPETPRWRQRQIVIKARRALAQRDCPSRLSFYEECEPDGLFFGVQLEGGRQTALWARDVEAEEDIACGFCYGCKAELSDGSVLCEPCAVRYREEQVESAMRAKVQCVACGDHFPPSDVIEHHTSYTEDRKVYVCRTCHLKIHRGKDFQHLAPVDTPEDGMKSREEARLAREEARLARKAQARLQQRGNKAREKLCPHCEIPLTFYSGPHGGTFGRCPRCGYKPQ